MMSPLGLVLDLALMAKVKCMPPWRRFIALAALLFSTFGCQHGAGSATTNTATTNTASTDGEDRFDVLFIAVDDLNSWTGFLAGHPQAKTPNLDELASRGMSFTNAHAPASACMPSRTAILTGVSPFTSGHYTQVGDWRDNPRLDGVTTLPRHFRNNGYDTRGAGKLFHAHTYNLQGFSGQQDVTAWDAYFPSLERQLPDEVFPAPPTPGAAVAGNGISTGHFDFYPTVTTDSAMGDGQVVDWVVREIEAAAASEERPPHFFSAGLYRPHLPWYVPQKYFDLHPLEQVVLPEYLANDLDDVPAAWSELIGAEPDLNTQTMDWIKAQGPRKWQEAVQGYLASVSFADAMIGRLIAALDASGRADKTIIVLWADHGFHLGQKDNWGKMTLWDETTRVPFLIVAPGITEPGSSSSEAVSTQSIYATLIELAGLRAPATVEGSSLVPLLRDPDLVWDDVAITTYGAYGNFAVRDDQHRYVVYANGDEEFYDLAADPLAWKNVAQNPAYAELKAALAARLPDPATHAPAIVKADELALPVETGEKDTEMGNN